ncbi:MAG: MbtH family NRPS accessory protein [Proteobacteria bacterium]|nr:MbtH family NRPS accessory protein [Pseudomonadota bacterium]
MQQDYLVVVNEEEQYSIWPAGKEVPAGWSTLGAPAAKEACLADIERLWVDMRPKSLRMAMDRDMARQP